MRRDSVEMIRRSVARDHVGRRDNSRLNISQRRLTCEALEDRRLLSISLPGLQLVDPSMDRFDGQIVYLDFGREEGVTYRGPVAIEGIDVPGFSAPANLEGQEESIIADIMEILTTTYADSGVMFVTSRPEMGVAYSTVYVGGDDSGFAGYGSFYGLAEKVDFFNLDPADNAFVFTDSLAAAPSGKTPYADTIASFVAHETGHLLGFSHDDHDLLGSDLACVDDASRRPLANVAYAPVVHKYIVEEAIELFSDEYPDAWNYEDFSVSLDGTFGTQIWDAAEEEDVDQAPWGGDPYLDGYGYLPMLEHFFDPDWIDALDGLRLDVPLLPDIPLWPESALDRAELYWNDSGSDYVLSTYRAGDAADAWSYLGRVAHLVGDMNLNFRRFQAG